jgi:pyruvate/2-oxoglutarate dehydrogenase complex dihydrolipoamide acyltransferase (E2) component
MRFHLCAAAVLAAASSSAAQAATFPDEAPAGKMWMSCFISLKDTQYGAKNPIALGGYWLIDVPEGTRKETLDRLKAQWLKEYLNRIPAEFPGFVPRMANGEVYDARCGSYYDRSDWPAYAAHVKEPVTSQGVFRSDFVPSFAEAWISTREHARDYTGEIAFSGNIKPSKPVAKKPSAPPSELTIVAPDTASSGKSPKQQAEEAEAARKAAREQREAEFQAKLAEHDAQVADYERKVAEREAEIARQKEQQAAAADAAAREIAAYRSKMEEHRAEVAEADRRQQAYEAERRRYNLCVTGNGAACSAITAGAPAAEKIADAGKASTDTDATRCVSNPVVGPSATWKGATAATVVNGCPTAIDVRICLLREGGWNCGVNWALQPQEKWAWWSFNASGEIFWDARVAGP